MSEQMDEFYDQQIDEQEWVNLIGEGPSNNVDHPRHYQWYDMEVIDLVKKILTTEEYLGYLKGTDLVYRMRAGKKATIFEDIQKALKYESFYRDFVKENTPPKS